MLTGASAFKYFWNFSVYWNDPSLFLDLNRGGLSEVGALSGAILTAAALCWRNPRISFMRLCCVGTLPTLFAIALGRWGCFFAGCCVGVKSSFFLALHFPYDPASVTRHPTQIYYSLSAAAILTALWIIEKRALRRSLRAPSIITPLGLLFYSVMRLSIDVLREETGAGMVFSHALLAGGLPIEALWLAFSWQASRKIAL
jgi:phosphatidylglycerol:prolipoprotein diacylglycerol transferase